ncbi:MAG: SUMF1/EgtB/PvdO family nonheme iron enzyme [Acidobacteria bacterium]|nr:SUMF1/EgtB/PvdO family nonheme iron enzyme [Acidobacteriota bacterium]
MKECPACHRCFADQVNHCPSDGDRLKFLINLDTTLDERYLLERKLGQGGMGLVFKAQHKFIKTQHAIKVILPDLVGNDPSLAARFRQEAMAAAAIRHPNTVSVTDYGVLQGTTPYLVMEFVEGRSLHEILSEQKRLSPVAAVEIILAVCAGVAAAHRQGIVHRDLKPLNIMFRPGEPPGETLKVLDFGLAKIKSGELLGSFVAAQTQGMMGSPFYMAPEQWSDDEIDVRADIYSIGVILYQMIAGDVPFKGKSVPSIMQMHLNTPPVPLSERGIEVPPLLERAVQHALEKDPAKRPQSVDEFVAELREAMPQLGGADLREPGATTVQIGPSDTMGFNNHQGLRTGEQRESADSLKTVAGGADILSTGAVEAVSEPAANGPDTGRQSPAQTGGPFGAGQQTSTDLPPYAALTEPLAPDTFAAEEERRRAEALRRQQEEEEQRRQAEESARREAEERQRLEAEARARREQEEQQRREVEERQRRELEERQRRELEERQRREAEERAAAAGAAAGAAAARPHVVPPGVTPAGGGTTTSGSRTPLIIVGVVVLLGLLAGVFGLGYFVFKKLRAQNSNGIVNRNAGANANANAQANTSPTPSNQNTGEQGGPRADLLWIPGGTFQMGRADAPPITDELKASRAAYLLWMYNQWPAHEVTVGPFAIDRTEVTNAEYAEFVKETGHAPPPKVWDGAHPKAGEERLPVSNVSYDDANAFAAWRSKRDGATYRLPTEEEWEFAARGGDSTRLFPWGAEWSQGYANLGGTGVAPVGSYPLGRTPQGLDDMIGNVWEWTASEASMYKGNDRTVLKDEDRGKLVIRGGAFNNRADGDKPISVAARSWFPRNFRDATLGFRLVRAEQ